MKGLRVLLLGSPRLEFDGRALTPSMPPKRQALVYYLSTRRETLDRAQLASLLWGDRDDASARASLRTALYELRRDLPQIIVSDRRTVALATGACVSIDLHELERALDKGAAETLRIRAVEAWRGEFLEGFIVPGNASEAFEDWVRMKRLRVQENVQALRHSLLVDSERRGDVEAAIEHARALLDVDDADEVAHMTLMRLLHTTGRRSAALAQYEVCRAALEQRLDARPSSECVALYGRIREDAPPAARPVAVGTVVPISGAMMSSAVAASTGTAVASAVPQAAERVPVAAVPPPPVTALATPPSTADIGTLIGREYDLERLAERLGEPDCRWLTVVGPGGCGKTRLAVAALERLDGGYPQGALWLSGLDDEGVLRDGATLVRHILERLDGAERIRPGALLLVLDNLETVLDARGSVEQLLYEVPATTVLATSRVRVGGGREWLLELGGLSLERDEFETPASSPAARLFVACAQRLDSGCDAPVETEAIEFICEQVGGLPLAIQMAARAADRVGGIARVAERLESDAAATLNDLDRDPGDRHRSMTLVLQESWDKLPAVARPAALRLAAAGGVIDAELAQAIGVDVERLELLRAHHWLAKDGQSFSLHALQREFLLRHSLEPSHTEDVSRALFEHLWQLLPEVTPFGDLPSDNAHIERLAGRAMLSSPALAVTLERTFGEDTAVVPVDLLDRLVAVLVALERQQEAVRVLEGAIEHGGVSEWLLAGWRLRSAELLTSLGNASAALRVYGQAFDALGLGAFEYGAGADLARCPVNFWRLLRLRPARGDDKQRFAAFRALLFRSLLYLVEIFSFSPKPAPMLRAGSLLFVASRVRGGTFERDLVALTNAWAMTLFGFTRPAARVWRRPRAHVPESADTRAVAFAVICHSALGGATGQWQGIVAALDENVRRCEQLRDMRHAMEARSLAAKLLFYEGLLAQALERFTHLTELGRGRPGDAWRVWGPIGQIEVALCLDRYNGSATLRRRFDHASREMTEYENVDGAYTLRCLGLAAQLARRDGNLAAAREAVVTAVAASERIFYCGFWAHEGFANIGECLFELCSHERRVGGALPPLERAWLSYRMALRRHHARFVPAAALRHRMDGCWRLGRDDREGARRAFRRSVAAAEHYGMRVDLARVCEHLAVLDAEGDWSQRASALWEDMRGGLPSPAP